MEDEVKSLITQRIMTAFPGTDLELDVDWEVTEIAFDVGYQFGLIEKTGEEENEDKC